MTQHTNYSDVQTEYQLSDILLCQFFFLLEKLLCLYFPFNMSEDANSLTHWLDHNATVAQAWEVAAGLFVILSVENNLIHSTASSTCMKSDDIRKLMYMQALMQLEGVLRINSF